MAWDPKYFYNPELRWKEFRPACRDAEDPVEDIPRETGEDCWIKPSDNLMELLQSAAIAIELKPKCESPIEVNLGIELMIQCRTGYCVCPQFKWRNFRMDFAITSGGRICAFIECDGAEFHSTPQQLANDDRKNRAAAEAGIPLFRYRGSDIFHHAQICANEVWSKVS